MNAEPACFVIAGGHYASFPASSNNYGFTLQRRIIQYLDTYKKRVEVKMGDISLRGFQDANVERISRESAMEKDLSFCCGWRRYLNHSPVYIQ
jgi:hypothetical protein